jgi:formylglycine-generating enzyme required for sulfatase activity
LPDYIQPNNADLVLLKADAYKAELDGDLKLAETIWTRLVRFDLDEALASLYRIRDKLKEQPPLEKNTNEIPSSFADDSKSVISDSSFNSIFEFEVVTVNNQGKVINRETKQAEYLTEKLNNDTALEMVSIPSGTFIMGTDDAEIKRLVKKFDSKAFRREKPQHKVTVRAFSMSKYPITQKQWKAIAALDKIDRDLSLEPSYFKGDDLPVEQVSWNDSVEFCKRLSKLTGQEYRLPSEAEWEYACRAVISHQSSVISEELFIKQWNEKYHQPFYCGETITTELANYNGNYLYAEENKGIYREKTTPVGSFPPNAFGLYDMHGNVWEWCADDWHDNYDGAPTDGSAWISNDNSITRILRGGSYFLTPRNCRSASRNSNNAGAYNRGFRVVCVPPRSS